MMNTFLKQAIEITSFGVFVLVLIACLALGGCIQVGGSSSDICDGTECGTHDESDRSVDNTNNSNQNAVY